MAFFSEGPAPYLDNGMGAVCVRKTRQNKIGAIGADSIGAFAWEP
jgi:hypothetical protein